MLWAAVLALAGAAAAGGRCYSCTARPYAATPTSLERPEGVRVPTLRPVFEALSREGAPAPPGVDARVPLVRIAADAYVGQPMRRIVAVLDFELDGIYLDERLRGLSRTATNGSEIVRFLGAADGAGHSQLEGSGDDLVCACLRVEWVPAVGELLRDTDAAVRSGVPLSPEALLPWDAALRSSALVEFAFNIEEPPLAVIGLGARSDVRRLWPSITASLHRSVRGYVSFGMRDTVMFDETPGLASLDTTRREPTAPPADFAGTLAGPGAAVPRLADCVLEGVDERVAVTIVPGGTEIVVPPAWWDAFVAPADLRAGRGGRAALRPLRIRLTGQGEKTLLLTVPPEGFFVSDPRRGNSGAAALALVRGPAGEVKLGSIAADLVVWTSVLAPPPGRLVASETDVLVFVEPLYSPPGLSAGQQAVLAVTTLLLVLAVLKGGVSVRLRTASASGYGASSSMAAAAVRFFLFEVLTAPAVVVGLLIRVLVLDFRRELCFAMGYPPESPYPGSILFWVLVLALFTALIVPALLNGLLLDTRAADGAQVLLVEKTLDAAFVLLVWIVAVGGPPSLWSDIMNMALAIAITYVAWYRGFPAPRGGIGLVAALWHGVLALVSLMFALFLVAGDGRYWLGISVFVLFVHALGDQQTVRTPPEHKTGFA